MGGRFEFHVAIGWQFEGLAFEVRISPNLLYIDRADSL